jgi:transcriptional regulator with XRE-family HTH domain
MKQPEVSKRLGRRVNAYRRARGYTQEQLAERCGFTSKFISEVERGVVNVPIGTLARIGGALATTISELTLGIDGMTPHVTRDGEAIYAGRSRGEQAAIAKILGGVEELVREAKGHGPSALGARIRT